MHQSAAGTIKFKENVIGEFGEINPTVLNSLEIEDRVYCFEMDIEILSGLSKVKMFTPIPANPAQVEDLTLTFPPKTRIGDVLKFIINNSKIITNIELKDTYKGSYTFRIWYQDPEKTLTNEETEKIRKTLLSAVKLKFGGILKD